MKEKPRHFADAAKYHQELVDKIKLYNKHYYEESTPLVSDAEYDYLVALCASIESEFPSLKINSPIQEVGGTPSSRFGKVEHRVPMLSLSNVFTEEETGDFIERLQKFLKIDYFPQIIAELKIDGLSFSAIYKKGILEIGASRGDGRIGEDITPNIKTIANLPHHIDIEDELFEVRGEIYINKEDFRRLNEEHQIENKQVFANPRNAASGALRNLDIEITRSRPLRYYVYSIGFSSGKFAGTQSQLLDKLETLGFLVNPIRLKARSLPELKTFYAKYRDIRDSLEYEIDGLVYKVDDFVLCHRLGSVGKNPRYATAHKFPSYLATTQLLDIKVQVGRTGALTPVAILEPVHIAGVLVSRASLHNFDEIIRKDIRIGDKVSLKRAGDVIPQIDSVVYAARENANLLPESQIPEFCPSCGSRVYKNEKDAVLRCNNGLKCKDQIQERLTHFVSKGCFNIEGLGKKQIIFLIEKNYIKDLSDIFNLPTSAKLKDLAQEEQWGDLSVNNLVDNITVASNITLDRFIFALGIRHIGAVTSKILANIYKDYDNFIDNMQKLSMNDDFVRTSIDNIDGFGSEMTASLVEFFQSTDNMKSVSELSKKLTFQTPEIISSVMSDKIIVFTGSLEQISRHEAKSIAEKYGAKVTSSVTTKTDYLVAGKKPGSKLQEALKHGVPVLSEQEWLNMIQ